MPSVVGSVDPCTSYDGTCNVEPDDPNCFTYEQKIFPEDTDKLCFLRHLALFYLNIYVEYIGNVIDTLKSEDIFRACNTETLQTDHRRKTVFKNCFNYVEPESICGGQNESGKECFAQCIPVKNTV